MNRKEISGAFADSYQESSSESDPSRVSIHVGDNRISNVLLAGSGGVELTRTYDTNNEGEYFYSSEFYSIAEKENINKNFKSLYRKRIHFGCRCDRWQFY